MPKRLYSINETAHALGIGRTKTYELIADGVLKTITIGRRRLVKAESIDLMLADILGAGYL